MKHKTFWISSLGLALAALPLWGGGEQGSAGSAAVYTSDANPAGSTGMAEAPNGPSPEVAAQQLANAPGQGVSAASAPPRNVNLTGPAAEVVKLAQAGVDENVMLSFVANSPNTFNLSSDAIVYLNDIGVPGTVVTAMMQHDEKLKADSAASAVTAAPPIYTNQLAPAPGSPAKEAPSTMLIAASSSSACSTTTPYFAAFDAIVFITTVDGVIGYAL